MGVVTLILVPNDEMIRRERTGLIDFAEEQRKKKGGEALLGIQDVNKIFGWAIFDLRRIKTKHMHKHEEGRDTRIELQMEIDFLRSMMFYREEAMLDQAYMEKCYDIFMRTC